MKQEQQRVQPESTPSNFAVGSIVFEKFEVLEFIASGGNGRVYKARDTLRNVPVALKVLLVEGSNEKALMRFQSEARLASKLKHHNIATMYDFGLEGRTPYLAMEFVEGESLQQRIERTKTIPLRDFVAIFIPVCEAIAHAHSHDVIHRDLKPGNIMVQESDDRTIDAKILDFGIATRIDTGENGRITPTGDIVGSPLYMSPEQSKGGQSLTPQSDIYSLGCVMYHCLSGKPPFQGETAIDTILQHQKIEPSSLYQQLDQDNEAVPEEVCELIDAMLSKQPDLRPGLSGSVLTTLLSVQEQLQTEEEEQATDISDSEFDSGPPLVSSKGKSWMALAALALILVGFVSFLCQPISKQEKEAAPKIIVREPEIVNEESILGESTEAEDTPALRERREVLLRGRDVTDKDLEKLSGAPNIKILKLTDAKLKRLDVLPTLPTLSILDLTATQITAKGVESISLCKHLTKLILRRTPITDDSIPKIAKLTELIELDLGGTKITCSRLSDLKTLKKLDTLRLVGLNVKPSDLKCLPPLLPALTTIDLRYCEMSPEDEAQLSSDCPDVYFLYRQPEGRVSAIAPINKSGIENLKRGNYSMAKRDFKEIVSLMQKAYGKESPRILQYYLTLGESAYRAKDSATAREAFTHALKVSRKEKDKAREQTALGALSKIGPATAGLEAAAPRPSQSAEASSLLPGDKGELEQPFLEMGNRYCKNALWAKALPYYQKSRTLRSKLHGSRSPEVALVLTYEGNCLRGLKKFPEAVRKYNKALAIFKNSKEALNNDQTDAKLMSYAGLAQMELESDKASSALEYNDAGINDRDAPERVMAYVTLLKQRVDIYKILKQPPAEIAALQSRIQRLENQQSIGQKNSTK